MNLYRPRCLSASWFPCVEVINSDAEPLMGEDLDEAGWSTPFSGEISWNGYVEDKIPLFEYLMWKSLSSPEVACVVRRVCWHTGADILSTADARQALTACHNRTKTKIWRWLFLKGFIWIESIVSCPLRSQSPFIPTTGTLGPGLWRTLDQVVMAETHVFEDLGGIVGEANGLARKKLKSTYLLPVEWERVKMVIRSWHQNFYYDFTAELQTKACCSSPVRLLTREIVSRVELSIWQNTRHGESLRRFPFAIRSFTGEVQSSTWPMVSS
jgi:hypothetical protein